jgi:hypothetical protein
MAPKKAEPKMNEKSSSGKGKKKVRATPSP